MSQPTGGTGPTPPSQPSPQPTQPSSSPTPLNPSDSNQSSLLQSPFAKMFQATGAMPTYQEIRAIIDGILKQQVTQIQNDDAEWKKSMEKLKRTIEGDDDQ